MLTEFFTLNQEHPEANDHLYADILKYYTFDKTNKVYKERSKRTDHRLEYGEGGGVQRSTTVGRIPIIGLNVHQKEKFFLRMLLYHVKGPKCWEDLRTVNGVVYETFHEACIKLGLFEDDSEIENCLAEAATIRFPKQFRRLFVTLMTQSLASNPKTLFEKFKTELCEDIMKDRQVKELK